MVVRSMAKAGLVTLLLGAVIAGRAGAQQTSTEDLKKEIESLREVLKGIQKDLQEIKGMLASRGGPANPVNVVIDLADNPSKGERTAKLTLVEFSDYQ